VRHLTIRLSGPARACRAVMQHLSTLPLLGLPIDWSVRESPGRCEIREGARAVVASTWESAVRLMLAAPTPLCEVVVRGPGRWK